MENCFQRMNEIYEHLQDEESRALFEARLTYLIMHNEDKYMETVGNLYQDWHSKELEEKIMAVDPKGIIVFGCGHDGQMINQLMNFWGYSVSYFCDTYKYGKIVDGKKVLSVTKVIEECRDYLIVIASSIYGKEMYIELVQKGFPYTNILLPRYKYLYATRGKQYFDVFRPQPEEIYIDAGTFNGGTVLDFIQWANGRYKKIYAFEPIDDMCKIICQTINDNDIHNIEILNSAVWNRKETICFTENGPGSHVSNLGKVEVQGIDIDYIVKDEKVTFIKMDVEGSELKALKGARNTIISNCPKLAICIYHKPLDVIEIASYILELVPQYRLYIRHYASNMWETVLYAEL